MLLNSKSSTKGDLVPYCNGPCILMTFCYFSSLPLPTKCQSWLCLLLPRHNCRWCGLEVVSTLSTQFLLPALVLFTIVHLHILVYMISKHKTEASHYARHLVFVRLIGIAYVHFTDIPDGDLISPKLMLCDDSRPCIGFSELLLCHSVSIMETRLK
jgi:hypothetical protein